MDSKQGRSMSESRRNSISALIRELFSEFGRDPNDVELIRKCNSFFAVYSGSLIRSSCSVG